ncbi:MAG: hypothetical protein IKT10_01190 [Clostridiales bacterium]|nr:hypothetical protein [Clostridiales bacterium]
MKTKTQTKLLIFTTVLMFLIVAAYGFIDSWQKSKSIVEGLKTGITLKETVVFDDQHIVERYGGPVTLEAGTAGEIFDVIDWHIEKYNNKHIKASFDLNEGQQFNVILGYEMGSEKDTDIIIEEHKTTVSISDGYNTQENHSTYVSVTPVININKIKDSQKIASEFKQMRERYYQRVRQTIRDGSIKGAIVALALVAVIWLVKLIVRKEKAGKVLVILTICIDGLMLSVDMFAFYFTLAMA